MWKAMTAPFQLTSGTLYAASLDLSFVEKLAATDAIVAQKFTDVGFTGVTVDLPNKRVEGTWSGDSQEVTLPGEVQTVWEWVLS
jgi:hypothetical protein